MESASISNSTPVIPSVEPVSPQAADEESVDAAIDQIIAEEDEQAEDCNDDDDDLDDNSDL